MSKKKIIKLNDEEYLAYIMSLKDEPALYCADGEIIIPDTLFSPADKDEEE